MTREEIEVAIEAAEHALERAMYVVEDKELRDEIARLNNLLRETE